MKGLIHSESEQNYIDKQNSLEAFHEKFKGFSGKNIDAFSTAELEHFSELIKEFFSRHAKAKVFFEAVESIQSDIVKKDYI
jgi:hypothetical protein